MEILGHSIGQESRQVLGEIMMIHNGLIHVPWSNYMRLRLINCAWLSHHAWGEQHLFLDALVGLPSRIHCRYSEKGHWAKRRFLFVRWWSRQIRKHLNSIGLSQSFQSNFNVQPETNRIQVTLSRLCSCSGNAGMV